MDEILLSEAALAFLRQMQYDPDGHRGFEYLSTSFHWSDEGLRRARRLYRDHDRRAIFDATVLRTSLIKGEPIDEPHRTWEQLWARCPDWPGFPPERCSTEILPEWQWALKRMCIGFEREWRASKRDEGKPV